MFLKDVKDMREGKLSACVFLLSMLHYNRWNGLQQGGIKPERFLLYSTGGPRLTLTLHSANRETREEEDELFWFCL